MTTIAPAGHAAGLGRREPRPESVSEAETMLLNFLECKSRSYKVPLDAAHSAVLKHQGHPEIHWAGEFLSRVYSGCTEKVIVHDLDMHLDSLGTYLSHDKLLINTGAAGDGYGRHTKGVTINCGIVGNHAAYRSYGLTVNAGIAGKQYGDMKKGGIVAGLRDPESYGRGRGVWIIESGHMSPQMREYLEELVALCKGPEKALYDRYGDVPAITIRDTVREFKEAPEVHWR